MSGYQGRGAAGHAEQVWEHLLKRYVKCIMVSPDCVQVKSNANRVDNMVIQALALEKDITLI